MRRMSFLVVILMVLANISLYSPAHAAESIGESCISLANDTNIVATDRGVIECIVIDSVTATFSNTVPVSVDLHISGQRWQQMDRYRVQIDQWREGNDIYIAIYREITPSSTATTTPYTTTVRLDDQFEPGSVQVHVNQYTLEIAIPDAPPPRWG